MSIFLLSIYDSTATAPFSWFYGVTKDKWASHPPPLELPWSLHPLKPQARPASSSSTTCRLVRPLLRWCASVTPPPPPPPPPPLHQIKKKTSGRYLLAPRAPQTLVFYLSFSARNRPPKGEVISYRERIGAQIYDICPHVTVCLGYAVALDTVAHERSDLRKGRQCLPSEVERGTH